ncbi:MAG: hypothetical protein ACREV1_00170 [Gammaproteobacteria bacterium]
MKYSKAEVHCKTHSLPALRFEDTQLTSFSGLVLIQALFARLGLKERLRRCFSHLTVSPIFGHATLVLCLVLHLTLGYRRIFQGPRLRVVPVGSGKRSCGLAAAGFWVAVGNFRLEGAIAALSRIAPNEAFMRRNPAIANCALRGL